MKHVLADAINRMPDRERLVLTLYYYEGLTLAEIGNGTRRHREPRVPDPHEGDPATARPSRRARSGLSAEDLVEKRAPGLLRVAPGR